MSQQTLQAARGLYEAFNRGDLNAFERACARRFEWNEADKSLNAGGNPYRNFAQVLEGVFKPTMRDFEDFRVAPVELQGPIRFLEHGRDVLQGR